MLAADGKEITGADDLVRLLDAEKIDRTVPFDVLRRSDQRRFWAALRQRKQALEIRLTGVQEFAQDDGVVVQAIYGPKDQGN